MRRPGEEESQPPGGRAAERLREFLGSRFGREADMPPGTEEPPPKEQPDEPAAPEGGAPGETPDKDVS